jgi:hypothetical protein
MNLLIAALVAAAIVLTIFIYFVVKRPDKLANAEAKIREAEGNVEDALSKLKK